MAKSAGMKAKADKPANARKDPAHLKKPVAGAFGCFLAKNRAAFTEQVRGQPVIAVTKLASKRWKRLGKEEQEVYQEEYEAKKASCWCTIQAFQAAVADQGLEPSRHIKHDAWLIPSVLPATARRKLPSVEP